MWVRSLAGAPHGSGLPACSRVAPCSYVLLAFSVAHARCQSASRVRRTAVDQRLKPGMLPHWRPGWVHPSARGRKAARVPGSGTPARSKPAQASRLTDIAGRGGSHARRHTRGPSPGGLSRGSRQRPPMHPGHRPCRPGRSRARAQGMSSDAPVRLSVSRATRAESLYARASGPVAVPCLVRPSEQIERGAVGEASEVLGPETSEGGLERAIPGDEKRCESPRRGRPRCPRRSATATRR